MYKWDEISLWIPNRFLKIETGENNSKGNETCLENLGKKSKEKVFALPVKTQYSSQDGMVLAEEKEKKIRIRELMQEFSVESEDISS